MNTWREKKKRNNRYLATLFISINVRPPVYTFCLTSAISNRYLGASVSEHCYFQNVLYLRNLKNFRLLFELLNIIGE